MPLRNRGLTMHAQRLMALGVILLLSGCKGQALPLPFVSKPTTHGHRDRSGGQYQSNCQLDAPPRWS